MPSFDVTQRIEVTLRIRSRFVCTDAICPRVVASPLPAMPDLTQRDSVVRLNRLDHALALKVAELPNFFRDALVSASSSPRPSWYFRLRRRTEQDLITAGPTAMGQFLSTSRRAFPALNVGTVEAAIEMASPTCDCFLVGPRALSG